MLYEHLKRIKNNHNYFNGIKADILAMVPATNDEFGTLVQYKVDRKYNYQYLRVINNQLK